jgi:hypothetical protein
MAVVQRIGGIAYLKINGAQYSLRGKAEIMPLSIEKTSVVGQDGPHGYTQKPKMPGFKMTITDLGGVSVVALQSLTGGVITLELDNGKTWILRDWLEGEISVNTEEGSFDTEFRGLNMKELVV